MKPASTHYQVSVYREQRHIWGCNKPSSCCNRFEIVRQTIDANTLRHYIKTYGINASYITGPHPDPGGACWFYASTPRDSLEEQRRGIETYFSLHVHRVDDRPATRQDYLDIARQHGLPTVPSPARAPWPVRARFSYHPHPGTRHD